MLDDLIADLRRDEGWRDTPYQDHLGFWTIGYGFLIDARRPVPMPKEVGDLWMKIGAEDRFYDLVGRIPWLAEQPDDVQRALGNMAYQLGINGVLNFKKMLTSLQLGQRVSAAQHALDSVWATQTPERAQRVAKLIRGM